MSVGHLKSGGVQTESMQTPDGLQVDNHEICSFDCTVGGVHLESNWNVWRSVKYTAFGTCREGGYMRCEFCMANKAFMV